jgi:hypothetical protein
MNITHEYDEYYLVFEQESLLFFQGCTAVSVRTLIRNTKNINQQFCTATG